MNRGQDMVTLIRSSQKFDFTTVFMFSRVTNPLTTLPCLGNLENPGHLPVQEVVLEDTDDSVLWILKKFSIRVVR